MTPGRSAFETARDDSTYAEACGRVRVLEKRLLTSAGIDELLETRDLASLLQALRRLGVLSRSVEDLASGWERALELSLGETDRVLLALDPRPLVTRVLLARADLVNLRTLLRARAFGLHVEIPWLSRGLLGREPLDAMVRTGHSAAFPGPLAAVLSGLRDLPPACEGRCLNDFLDAAWFRALLAAVRESGSRLFLDWLGHRADLANLTARLRAIATRGAWPEPLALLPGGHLDAGVFAPAGGVEEVAARFTRTVYAPVLERARDGAGLSLARLEREADDFLTRLLQPARFIALGPEPLWAYHLAREIDAKNVRAIVLGTLAGIAPEGRRAFLRAPYA